MQVTSMRDAFGFNILLFGLSFSRMGKKSRVDETESYTLDGIRSSLIRQEDSIIFSLVERAQYCYNPDTYNPDTFPMEALHGSLIEYILKETEKLHAKVYIYIYLDFVPL